MPGCVPVPARTKGSKSGSVRKVGSSPETPGFGFPPERANSNNPSLHVVDGSSGRRIKSLPVTSAPDAHSQAMQVATDRRNQRPPLGAALDRLGLQMQIAPRADD